MSLVLPFVHKIGTTTRCPFPGAYIFVGTAGYNGMVPVYTSMSSFTDAGLNEFLNDRDGQVIVLPGYTLELYSSAAFGAGTVTVYDNRNGTDLLFRGGTNAASSCKLFYKFRTGYNEVIP